MTLLVDDAMWKSKKNEMIAATNSKDIKHTNKSPDGICGGRCIK
jgi:hypothetical protein